MHSYIQDHYIISYLTDHHYFEYFLSLFHFIISCIVLFILTKYFKGSSLVCYSGLLSKYFHYFDEIIAESMESAVDIILFVPS